MGATATASKDKQVSRFCVIPEKQRAQILMIDKRFFFEGSATHFRQSGRQVRIGFQPSCHRQVMKNSRKKNKSTVMTLFYLFSFRSVQKENSYRQTSHCSKWVSHTRNTGHVTVFKVHPDDTLEGIQTGRPNLIQVHR